MIEIKKYSIANKNIWDEFVRKSRNGLFLFYRDYMDYHQDRFSDYSLLLYKDKILKALFVANEKDGIIYSHQGLTFGGFITLPGNSALDTITFFETVIDFYKKLEIKKIIYKAIPAIYSNEPAADDRYALFRVKAQQYRTDLSTTIQLKDRRPHYQERRTRSIKKAERNGIKVHANSTIDDWNMFWTILTRNLKERHNTVPVHTTDEILSLHSKFPDHIKLFTAKNEAEEMLAGVVIYENEKVAHAQYISTSPDHPNTGALDLVFHHLISNTYADHIYFDFGISTENNGDFLNKGLVEYKEGFGGSSIVHEFYEINLLR